MQTMKIAAKVNSRWRIPQLQYMQPPLAVIPLLQAMVASVKGLAPEVRSPPQNHLGS